MLKVIAAITQNPLSPLKIALTVPNRFA